MEVKKRILKPTNKRLTGKISYPLIPLMLGFINLMSSLHVYLMLNSQALIVPYKSL